MASPKALRCRRMTRRSTPAVAGVALGALALSCNVSPDRRSEPAAPPPVAANRVDPATAVTAARGAAEVGASAAAGPTIVASSAGPSHVGKTPSGDGPRVYAKTRFVWIRQRPEWAAQWIGYLWPGDSVKLLRTRPIYARGCEAWYAVLPRGFVCVDGRRATLDAADPELAEIERAPITGSPSSRRYAESLGTQVYEQLPDRTEVLAREPDLPRRVALLDAARSGGTVDDALAGVDTRPATIQATPFTRLPIDIQVPRNSLRRQSTIAFLDEYLHDGRSYLLTTDLSWIPKDRVHPLDTVTFEGAHLDRGVRLPLAFFREHERPAYELGAGGRFSPSSRKFARLAWVELTGTNAVDEGRRYLETREPGLWVLSTDAVVPEPSATTPWGAKVSSTDEPAKESAERKTWIEASVYGGWLIAYENTRPVFVTLTAAGRGGAKRQDSSRLVTSSSTPLGTFPITGKFVTATMDGDGPDEIVHSDVPWVQNFRSAHAIHAAYWHDAWGELVSGGCLNVSPGDGRYLFGFTEPRVPEGWHGVRWEPHLGPTTRVVVHR